MAGRSDSPPPAGGLRTPSGRPYSAPLRLRSQARGGAPSPKAVRLRRMRNTLQDWASGHARPHVSTASRDVLKVEPAGGLPPSFGAATALLCSAARKLAASRRRSGPSDGVGCGLNARARALLDGVRRRGRRLAAEVLHTHAESNWAAFRYRGQRRVLLERASMGPLRASATTASMSSTPGISSSRWRKRETARCSMSLPRT